MLKRFLQVLAPLIVLLCVAFPAYAQSAIEGQDWWRVKPPSGKDESDAVYVKIAPDINLQTPAFIKAVNERFRFNPPLDMLALREENRDITIALCHKLGDGYHMGVIRSMEERRADRAWLNCRPEDGKERYVYVLPGQVIRLRGQHIIAPDKKLALADQIAACKDLDCLVRVSRELGSAVTDAGHGTPVGSSVDPFIAELTACNGGLDCVIAAARNRGIKVDEPVKDKPSTATTLAPAPHDDTGLIIALIIFIALTIGLSIALIISSSISSARAKLNEQYSEDIEKLQATLAGNEEALQEAQKKSAAAQGEVVSAKKVQSEVSTSLKGLTQVMQAVTQAMVDCAKRWNLTVPASYKQIELFGLIADHVDEVYAQIALANRSKLEVERRVQGLLTEVDQKAAEVGVLEQALRDMAAVTEADRLHCAELYALINQSNADLILIDNEATDLRGPFGELTTRHVEALKTNPDLAPDLQLQIDMCEARFGELSQARAKVIDRKAAAQTEFDALFEKLAGFKFTEATLYEEAQRDRNDAASELGKAKLLQYYAQARQDRLSVIEADMGERETAIEAREAAVALRESEQARRQLELDELSADTFELNLKWRGLMEGLLSLLGYDANKMKLEDIRAIDGSVGAVEEARRLLEAANGRLIIADGQVAALNSELAKQREASRLMIAENVALLAGPQSAADQLARYAVALEDEMRQRKVLRRKLGKAVQLQKRLERQLAAVSAERQVQAETIARLERELAEPPVPEFPKPTPVPKFPEPLESTSGVRRTDTMPYTAAFDGRAAQEAFFNAAEMILKEGGGLFLNTARRVWILFQLTQQRVRFDFAGIFPASDPGPTNRAALDLSRTREKMNRAIFCQEDLRWFIDLFEPPVPDTYRSTPKEACASDIPR
ncbi:MAG: hypothetical protein RDU25_00635 [Patescibacteria group bacterium]|nr:hypothetical protein [Patescibacteria group bacterium]